MKHFFIGEAIGFGWKSFKSNWKSFLIIDFVVALISFLPSFANSLMGSNFAWAQFIISAIGWIISSIVTLSLIKIILNLIDNKPIDVTLLFDEYKLLIYYIIGIILTTLITAVGLLLLIVPGIYFTIRLQLWQYYLVDKGCNPITAIKESWKATKGYGWDLMALGFVLGILNLIGLLAIFVGLIITAPVSMIATIYVYRQIIQTLDNHS